MIEAVSSGISSAVSAGDAGLNPRLQQQAEAEAAARAEAARSITALSAPFFSSPTLSFDDAANLVIVTYRDRSTGQVTQQFPANAVIKRYREARAIADAATGTQAAIESTAATPAANSPAPRADSGTVSSGTTAPAASSAASA